MDKGAPWRLRHIPVYVGLVCVSAARSRTARPARSCGGRAPWSRQGGRHCPAVKLRQLSRLSFPPSRTNLKNTFAEFVLRPALPGEEASDSIEQTQREPDRDDAMNNSDQELWNRVRA